MDIFLDIETIPGQSAEIINKCREMANSQFKVPSGLTKQQAAIDLNITDKKLLQSHSKDTLLEQWADVFKTKKVDQLYDEIYRKTALYGGTGEVISIAAICHDNHFSTYRHLHRVPQRDERDILSDFFNWVNEQCNFANHRTEPYFIGHNIVFDLKFLFHRSIILRSNPLFDLPFNGHHSRHFYCTSHAWCQRSKSEYISQDELAYLLGIEQKPEDIDGSKVWDFVKNGNEQRVNEYNNYDVDTVKRIYQRLHYR